MQSQNVCASPKHFLGNEVENGRRWSDSVIDERALREIYLEPFRLLIKHSSPMCLMTSYAGPFALSEGASIIPECLALC